MGAQTIYNSNDAELYDRSLRHLIEMGDKFLLLDSFGLGAFSINDAIYTMFLREYLCDECYTQKELKEKIETLIMQETLNTI